MVPVMLLGVLLAGCRGGGEARVDDQRQPFNRWTVQTLDDEAVGNAIIAQHTLYPYHFVNNSAELNPLGERDIKVLAQHFARNPGELNVRQGGVPRALYEARVASVTRSLVRYEVPQASIKIVDKLPGGEGVESYRAVLILNRSYAETSLSGDQGSHGFDKGGSDSGKVNSPPVNSDSGATKQ